MMELLRGRSRWSTLVFLLTWASVAATETLPRQVLLLYSYEREFAPHVAFAKQFLPELSRTATEPSTSSKCHSSQSESAAAPPMTR